MKLKIYADEAWRGPLAGPVLVWLTLPLQYFNIDDFQDSKKLNESKRIKLFNKIEELENELKLLYSFWFASNREIDRLWIKRWINIAFKRALIVIFLKFLRVINIQENWDKLLAKIKLNSYLNSVYKDIKNIEIYDFKFILKEFQKISKIRSIIFDWNTDFNISEDIWYKLITIIKWDDRNKYISASSIVAKTIRDEYMKSISSTYSVYKLFKHKWYGTAEHRDLIKKHGLSKIHRKTFCRNII